MTERTGGVPKRDYLGLVKRALRGGARGAPRQGFTTLNGVAGAAEPAGYRALNTTGTTDASGGFRTLGTHAEINGPADSPLGNGVAETGLRRQVPDGAQAKMDSLRPEGESGDGAGRDSGVSPANLRGAVDRTARPDTATEVAVYSGGGELALPEPPGDPDPANKRAADVPAAGDLDLAALRADGGVAIVEGQPVDSTTGGIQPRPEIVEKGRKTVFRDAQFHADSLVNFDHQDLAKLVATYRTLLDGETASTVSISNIVGYLHALAWERAEQLGGPKEESREASSQRFVRYVEKYDRPDEIHPLDVYDAIATTDELLGYAEDAPDLQQSFTALQTRLTEWLIQHTERVDTGAIIKPLGKITAGRLNKHLFGTRLKTHGVRVMPDAKEILDSPDYPSPDEKTTVELVGINNADLIVERYGDQPRETVFDYAAHHGLQPCPWWVGPMLLLQGRAPEKSKYFTLAMESAGNDGALAPLLTLSDKYLTTMGYGIGYDDTMIFVKPQESVQQ